MHARFPSTWPIHSLSGWVALALVTGCSTAQNAVVDVLMPGDAVSDTAADSDEIEPDAASPLDLEGPDAADDVLSPDVEGVAPDAPMPDSATPDSETPDSETPGDVTSPPDVSYCSAAPATPIAPNGPLPGPVQVRRGIDRWERAAYEALRDAVLADPGVHFLCIWDVETDRYVVESGPVDARKRLEFRRVLNGGGGVDYVVLVGAVEDIFPSTEAQNYGSWASLLAAFTNPGQVDFTSLNYATGDPRVGFLPPEAQSYPLPLERLAALFDGPDAPDVLGGLHPWALPAVATHGAMSVLQSRSTLMLSGKGVRQGLVLDDLAILPDVVPTVLAALGAPTTGGVGRDGTYADGLFLTRQDGRVLWEALTEAPCDRAKHAIVVLFDGLSATELNHEVLDADAAVELPTFKALAANGVVYRYGAVTNFPSVSAPGHMTAGSGLWSGHHGILANAYFMRDTQTTLNPFSLLSDPAAILADPEQAYAMYESAVAEGFETLAQAAHRAFGAFDPAKGTGAFVAVLNEIAVGGADYDTLDYATGKTPWLLITASLQSYQLADNLAVAEVKQLLGDTEAPVPTVLQLSLVSTDAAGEANGPYSDLLRTTLKNADSQLASILASYEARGALEDTVVVLVSDHGMELQDPTRASKMDVALAQSGVKFLQPFPGLVYLRTVRLDAMTDPVTSTVTVRVVNDDDDKPVAGATVACDACLTSAVTGDDGTVQVGYAQDATTLMITATHPNFNDQALTVAP
ncbi:MAG: alkaline phosphatase family protein [Myxococcales bacterium]|nr:alkaline phosphatase family protein [Myxococcales bacterium]